MGNLSLVSGTAAMYLISSVPAMPGRRIVEFLLVLYLAVDLSSPWLPGIFSFDDDDFFIDMIDASQKPVRLVPPAFAPPSLTLPSMVDAAPVVRAGTAAVVDVRVHGQRRGPRAGGLAGGGRARLRRDRVPGAVGRAVGPRPR